MAASSVVGLDIGSSQIKAVHLSRSRSNWSLAGAGIVPTPPESVQDGVILDAPSVTEAVRDLLRQFHLPASDTVAAVSGSHVLVRSIRVPDMNLNTLKKSIRFEAAKHVDQGTSGVSIDQSAVEFEVLGKTGSPAQLELLLVVAPNTMVNGRVAVMEGAGMEPVAVDVEAFALLRSMEAAGLMPPSGQAAVLMNMGATYTDLNIIVGDQVAVTRSIPIGGNALTSSLASMLNVPVEEAEQQKRHIDIAPGRASTDAMGFGVSAAPDPARQVTLPFVDELIRELKRSVIFFQSQAAEAGMNVSVDQLILAGGGTQLQGLTDYLKERLSMNVVLLDPLAHGAAAAPEAASWQGRGAELAVAMGLALKEYV
ncbi:MAG: type IV pilus assembly protein PilM [Armatimonadota bacterium]